MQKIVVSLYEIVDFVREAVNDLPRGHELPDGGRVRTEMIINATASLVSTYIRTSMRFLRTEEDPLIGFLDELGYPVKDLEAASKLDELCNEVDDFWLDITMVADSLVNPLVSMIGRRSISIEHARNSEELTIILGENVKLERYRRLLSLVKRMTPPKHVRELDDLEGVEEFINYSVDEVFKNILHPTVKEEVKRIYLEIVNRQ